MTLLRDLVHRSALRNRAAGEAPVGGSAFEHLVEDVDNEFIHTDLGITLGTWKSVGGHSDYSQPHIEMHPFNGVRVSDGVHKITLLQDGSIAFGNSDVVLAPDEVNESPSSLGLFSQPGTNYTELTVYGSTQPNGATVGSGGIVDISATADIAGVGVSLWTDSAAGGVELQASVASPFARTSKGRTSPTCTPATSRESLVRLTPLSSHQQTGTFTSRT